MNSRRWAALPGPCSARARKKRELPRICRWKGRPLNSRQWEGTPYPADRGHQPDRAGAAHGAQRAGTTCGAKDTGETEESAEAGAKAAGGDALRAGFDAGNAGAYRTRCARGGAGNPHPAGGAALCDADARRGIRLRRIHIRRRSRSVQRRGRRCAAPITVRRV